MNGFHDAANSVATIVSTGVLKPWQAVLWAATFNVLAWAVFHLSVAATVGKGIIDPSFVDNRVIFGALVGAISWNLITWYYGIPSSSSHALIGGMIGSALVKAGTAPLLWPGIIKTATFIVISPVLGMMLGAVLMLGVSWLCFRQTPRRVDRWFRRLQLVSSAAFSLGHGGNDAQKTMGIIAVLLYSQGYMGTEFHVPFWVVLACQAAMALGTLMGGWRIVRTMGSKITRLTPMQGCCAETGGSIMLFAATELGIPVSTTHTITGCIIGVGAAKKVSAVRWGVAREIVTAWIVTIPASAVIAALIYWASGLFA
jgi:PiT family inorganic phosphate transporter